MKSVGTFMLRKLFIIIQIIMFDIVAIFGTFTAALLRVGPLDEQMIHGRVQMYADKLC